MKKKTTYTDEPIGAIRIVPDMLPKPHELVLKEDVVKITLSLSKDSLNFFKEHAAKQHVPYQKMIRALVDSYARQHGA